jgi:hypothetical protein
MESLEELKAQLAAAKLECNRLREENERLNYALRIKGYIGDRDHMICRVKKQKSIYNHRKRKKFLYSGVYLGEEMMYILYGGNQRQVNRDILLLVHMNGILSCVKNQGKNALTAPIENSCR